MVIAEKVKELKLIANMIQIWLQFAPKIPYTYLYLGPSLGPIIYLQLSTW